MEALFLALHLVHLRALHVILIRGQRHGADHADPPHHHQQHDHRVCRVLCAAAGDVSVVGTVIDAYESLLESNLEIFMEFRKKINFSF